MDDNDEGRASKAGARTGGGPRPSGDPREPGKPRYSTLDTPIPPYLRARLQALAAVTGRTVAEVLEAWIDREIDALDEGRREVVDRIASSALNVGSVPTGEDG